MYELRYSGAAQKYLKKIKEKGLQKAFENALTRIAENPYIDTAKVGGLASLYGYDVFCNKTNYEIVYRIYEEDGQIVVVVLTGTRENF